MQIFLNCFHCDFYYHCFGLSIENGNQWAEVSEWSWTRAWISRSLCRLEHMTVSSVCSPMENSYLQKQKIWNLHNFIAAVPAVCSKYCCFFFFRKLNSHVVWLHEAFSFQWNLQVIEKTFQQIIQFGRLKAWNELHPFGMLCGVLSAIHRVPSLEPVWGATRIWVFRPCIPPKTC